MNKFIVLDGDFEAQLRRRLNLTGEVDKDFALQALKSKQQRFAVVQTHLDYLRAGAQIIRTNTRRVSIPSLRTHLGLSMSECLLMMEEATLLAKKALFKYYEETGGDIYNVEEYNRWRPLIAGSCGSYIVATLGDEANTLKEIKEMPTDYLLWFYKHRVKWLLESKVDLLAFDSISTINELHAIIRSLQIYPRARAWITFSCSQEGKLLDGTTFARAAILCKNALPTQIIALGPECRTSDLTMNLIKKSNSKILEIPFVIHASKNLFSTTEDADTSCVSAQRNFVQEWIAEGVRFIGGGTNTVPEDIKEICKQAKDCISRVDRKSFFLINPCVYQSKVNQSRL